ncbi:hypothetical protein ACFORG_08480 [Lutimaribacter marinistellae]|uniref:Uncharacterized protein n=1 Tax=Lutimaribacter marinistellae TaxID=1820329 RepID=A0ABV7TES0_9RHOB
MLKTVFPDRWDAIQRMCTKDETFAEICHDYETLSCMLPRDASDPTLQAIRESMQALEEEIRTSLDRTGEDAGPRQKADEF